MNTIWKSVIGYRTEHITMPAPAVPLAVAFQEKPGSWGGPDIVMWFQVDAGAPEVNIRIHCETTGSECVAPVGSVYVGTLQDDGYVTHWFVEFVSD